MQKNLEKLLSGMGVQFNDDLRDIKINGLAYNSGKVNRGDLFFAIKGYKTDGHNFLEDAQKRGAAAAIVEQKSGLISMPQITVEDSRRTMAQIAWKYYEEHISGMKLIGVTGTNGKTTTTYLIQSVFETSGIRCGRIGTIDYNFAEHSIPSWNTTPEAIDLLSMMATMKKQGASSCILEISSHGLALGRVEKFPFEIAIFTNLSHDHLDFHQDIEDYFRAKSKLFEFIIPGGTAVINSIDKYGQRLIQNIKGEKICIGKDIKAEDVKCDLNGIRFKVITSQGNFLVESPLIGDFNVDNILFAIATAIASGIDKENIMKGIAKLSNIAGRLEKIKLKNDVSAIVDYSHTPDSLEKALLTLKNLGSGKLILVFGCGGDRDRYKRAIMGEIAEKHADQVFVTSDNPRSENPDAIIDDILQGIRSKNNIYTESDRKKAILKALDSASENDIVLIAGKGHENYQEIKGVKHRFDDREVVLQWN